LFSVERIFSILLFSWVAASQRLAMSLRQAATGLVKAAMDLSMSGYPTYRALKIVQIIATSHNGTSGQG
jgi:hypothetical protein